MFDNFLVALPLFVIWIIGVELVEERRMKRGQRKLPMWVLLIAAISLWATADVLAWAIDVLT